MRTLTAHEIEKFTRQFPFLGDVVDLESITRAPKYFVLKAQVSVADGETLFTIPKFCHAPHWIGSQDDKYVGRVYPVAYAIDREGRIWRTLKWDYDIPCSFIKEVIGEGQEVKTVVLVRKYLWWHNVKDWLKKGYSTCVGGWSHHEYQVYICKQPKQGFFQLVQESNLAKNVRITDLISVSLAYAHDNREASAAIIELNQLLSRFVEKVGPELWQWVGQFESRGMSGMFGSTMLMAYTIAGRIMISFWCGTEQITFVGDDQRPDRTGLQSMCCTVETAKRIIQDVIDNWQKDNLQPDKEVSML